MLLGTYNPDAHRGIARFAAERGWRLHVDMARIPLVPHGWLGDGIVAGLGEWDEPVEFLRGKGVAGLPVVDIYRMRPEVRLPRVVGDHREVGLQAAAHLIEAGWRRFAWFSRVNHPVAILRREGFAEGLALSGGEVITLAPEVTLERSAAAWETVRTALVRDLRQIPTPFAVMAFNDYDAALVEDACLDACLQVPDDVGIVGVDNNDLVVNSAPVPLSSVRLDLERIGYEGAALLERLMNGEKAPARPLLIPPRGVAARASTDAIPASHPAVRRALAYMKKHFREKLTVDRIARAAGVPRRTLEAAFRKDIGATVHAQVLKMRLRAACDALAGTGKTVGEIARDCGFSHGPHLHAEFQRSLGCSPREWQRRRNGGEQLSVPR